MSDTLLIAIVTGLIAIGGEIIIALIANKAMMNELEKQSALADARLEKARAVTDTKLQALTEEVRKHNGFADRIPVLEEKVKVANHRIDDLERK